MKIGNNTKVWHPEKSIILEANIGSDCVIHAPVWIGNIAIGDRTKVQAFSFIPDGVTIGKDCFVGPNVVFTNDKYPPSQGKNWSETIVEDGCVIGAGAVILPGVVLGRDSRIGAGSVVTRSVPEGVTVVGNPARPLTK